MVEFAVILPILLSILAGMAELSHAVDEWRKLSLVARSISDLTSQENDALPISPSTMSNIFDSARMIMRPFDSSNVKIAISAMGVNPLKNGVSPQVCSSYSNILDPKTSPARSVGVASELKVPTGYYVNGMRYVLAEVSIGYSPMIGSAVLKFFTGADKAITLSASVPWPTRGGKAYGSNSYSEVVLPSINSTASKACDV